MVDRQKGRGVALKLLTDLLLEEPPSELRVKEHKVEGLARPRHAMHGLGKVRNTYV